MRRNGNEHDREQGTGNREQGTGNREQGTGDFSTKIAKSQCPSWICNLFTIQNSRFAKLKRAAFSLAETIVVILIIGIIAFFLIHTIESVQKSQTISKLKETYSILSQAVTQMETDNGGTMMGLFPISYDNIQNINVFAKYLKTSKVCYGKTNSLGKCWPSEIYNYDGLASSGIYSWTHFDYISSATLNNGVSIAIITGYIWGESSNCSSSNWAGKTDVCTNLFVDLNGPKPPNKAGYDVFAFYVSSNGKLVSWREGGSNWCMGCCTGGGQMENKTSTWDKLGYTCAARIIDDDNWQINYDYH